MHKLGKDKRYSNINKLVLSMAHRYVHQPVHASGTGHHDQRRAGVQRQGTRIYLSAISEEHEMMAMVRRELKDDNPTRPGENTAQSVCRRVEY